MQRDGERDPVCKRMKPCKKHGEQGTDLKVLESLDVSVGVNMCKLKNAPTEKKKGKTRKHTRTLPCMRSVKTVNRCEPLSQHNSPMKDT